MASGRLSAGLPGKPVWTPVSAGRNTEMKQGHSGSAVTLAGDHVEKVTSDRAFAEDRDRQTALIELSRRTALLPRISQVDGATILMETIGGNEGLTEHNAEQAGTSLRLLHDLNGFSYPCLTGVDWLVLLANTALARANCSTRVAPGLAQHFQNDALIHSEPTQFIEANDGRIVFIDIEGIGRGSRYQDLGFIEYSTLLSGSPGVLVSFMRGYLSPPIALDRWRMRQMAGLIAIAYSRFADTGQRRALGLGLMEEAEQHLGGDALQRA
jgi:hypothetical protein